MGGRWRLLALAAMAAALVTGCSGTPSAENQVASLEEQTNAGQGDAQTGDGKTDEDKMRDYVKCMQEHGIDISAETGSDGGTAMKVEGQPGDEGKMKEADEACRPLMPNGGKPPKLDAEQLDRMREHAKCLREHGLDVPDPDPNNPGISIGGGPADQAKIDEAMKACGDLMPGGGGKVTSDGGGGEKSLSGDEPAPAPEPAK